MRNKQRLGSFVNTNLYNSSIVSKMTLTQSGPLQIKTDATRMQAKIEKKSNQVTEQFDELNDTEIAFMIDD